MRTLAFSNLANNDYLDLAKDKRMQSAGIDALSDIWLFVFCVSSITGYGEYMKN